MKVTSTRILSGAAVSTLALTVAALLAPAASAEPDDDLWACTDEERAEMHVPDSQSCYLTGEQLDQAGWVEVDPDQPAWCWPDESAPSWVEQAHGRMCAS